MIFTDIWSKNDNDKFRELVKDHKTPDEIISIIGIDKLNNNPKKKYVGRFSDFILNEITSKSKETIYSLYQKKSEIFNNRIDYSAKFETDSGEKYILDLVYVEDSKSPFPNKSMYNISFTIENQHDLTNSTKYEKETGKGEHFEVVSRLMYIISNIDVLIRINIPNIIYIIGDTMNQQKINFYRNIIKNSLSDYKELNGNSSINLGKSGFYYYL
jgi:NADH:ubiquinone oxidoreductase subunit C